MDYSLSNYWIQSLSVNKNDTKNNNSSTDEISQNTNAVSDIKKEEKTLSDGTKVTRTYNNGVLASERKVEPNGDITDYMYQNGK